MLKARNNHSLFILQKDIEIFKPMIRIKSPKCAITPNFKSPSDIRYNERSNVERVNGRLKDEFGGTTVRVRGHAKVLTHLMFGILVLTADQLMRLVV